MRVRVLCLLPAALLFLSASGICTSAHAQTSTPSSPSSDTAPSPENPQAGQHEQTPRPISNPQFFAGTVTTIDQAHVTVSRRLVGKAPESRTFLINARTKLSKGLRSKLRVTVRYQHREDGDVALEIQVRQSRPPKSS